jgi:hypothetical protein
MDVCRASGLSYRVIDYWVRVGAVEPSVPARGSGHSREWSPREFNILVALGRVWRDLNELGLTMGTALVRQLWVELYENGAALIALDTVMIGVSCD